MGQTEKLSVGFLVADMVRVLMVLSACLGNNENLFHSGLAVSGLSVVALGSLNLIYPAGGEIVRTLGRRRKIL